MWSTSSERGAGGKLQLACNETQQLEAAFAQTNIFGRFLCVALAHTTPRWRQIRISPVPFLSCACKWHRSAGEWAVVGQQRVKEARKQLNSLGSLNRFMKNTNFLLYMGVSLSCRSQNSQFMQEPFMSVCLWKELCMYIPGLEDVRRYLSKVPNIEQVEGLEQFTLLEAKLCLTNSQKCPDVLQTQELRGEKVELITPFRLDCLNGVTGLCSDHLKHCDFSAF